MKVFYVSEGFGEAVIVRRHLFQRERKLGLHMKELYIAVRLLERDMCLGVRVVRGMFGLFL